MNKLLSKLNYIYREEGIQILFLRSLNYIIYKIRRILNNNRAGKEKWKAIRNKFKGKRAFLIGNGPSINKLPLYLLKNEYAICFNRFNLMFERLNWIPQMYAAVDNSVISDMTDELKKEILPNIDYVFLPDLHPYNVNFKKHFGGELNLFPLFLDKLEFSNNLPYVGINKSVANVGLQILAYLGFDTIYIVGVDLDYSEPDSIKKHNQRDWTSTEDNDPNHFDPRYFGKGRSYHHPRMEETFQRFEAGKMFFDELGVKIYNAGDGGKLETYPRVNFDSLFKLSEKNRLKIFLQSCGIEGEYNSLEEGLGNFRKLKNITEWQDNDNVVLTDIELGLILIK